MNMETILAFGQTRMESFDVLKKRNDDLVAALRTLVNRCDGAEGVRADGSNIDTAAAHAVLGDFAEEA